MQARHCDLKIGGGVGWGWDGGGEGGRSKGRAPRGRQLKVGLRHRSGGSWSLTVAVSVGKGDTLGELLGEVELVDVTVPDGEMLADVAPLEVAVTEGDELGVVETVPDTLPEGECEGDGESVVETVPVPVTLGDCEPDDDEDGEPERVEEYVADGEGDTEALAVGVTDKVGEPEPERELRGVRLTVADTEPLLVAVDELEPVDEDVDVALEDLRKEWLGYVKTQRKARETVYLPVRVLTRKKRRISLPMR
jgi:hypothetical protein